MLKPMIGGCVAAGMAFFFMGLQVGMFSSHPRSDEDDEADVAKVVETNVTPKKSTKKEIPPPPAKFPEDLAPAARALPVERAAAYGVYDRIHKIVFLKVNGAVHPWHKAHGEYNEDWCAERVEETELAVIVGTPKKIFVDRTTFLQGPPVERFRWEVEASVVEAKTGRVLANRTFVNLPRAIRRVEDYGLTSIGQPVHYRTVFSWVAGQSRIGFPVPMSNSPVVTTVGD